MADNTYTLAANALRKRYHSRQVVRNISLHITSNEIVGLLGPNGAGKTTSFYMLLGLVKPDAGDVFLDDTPITDLAMHERARLGIGYLPQEASIFRKMTVFDNIMAIVELQPSLNAKQRKERCDALMQELRITDISDSLGMSLSGGERRRVEIARTLAMSPKFILLDEPFAGIDPIAVKEIKGTIKTLNSKGIGIFITDHNVRETLDICHRAYIVSDGHVIAEGAPKQLLQDEKAREIYLGDDMGLYANNTNDN